MPISAEKSKKIQIERRKQILDAALELFDEKGYYNTRVSDIAQAIGVSKALIFKYFPLKIDIFKAITEYIENCLVEVLNGPTPTDSLRNFGLKITSTTKDYIPPMRIYIATFIKGELPTDMNENFLRTNFAKKWLAPIIRQGQVSGEFRGGDPEELANAFWLYILGAVANYIHNRNNVASVPDIEIPLSMLKK
ncbi:TetR/AcrR family transcriptional regulator [Clostridium magnum]|uniref:HTH-type transcriptional regulator AcrR n=1 Tax=Clostridium magnum DSM 2767 TaxID=1121326 RepID=A0A162U742_9CLOT|nr:TetR/AcrR family transcriptional regulator [Clostridium magnum]KZL93607.1 HTH-type transcriptional regulator AcrR [Clostridium magnum DSM 2767]SHI58125.1 transcriptional regulator, TetR family [Clostridium magnum DSM 2767]